MEIPVLFQQRIESLPGKLWTQFTQAYQHPLRRGLRVNTSKISVAEFLALFPHQLKPSPFCAESFYLDADHKAGSDPLHHAGAYYMQEPSASSAVTVLDPRPGERILDLCAAPGGKSTQILAALGGNGLLWSNEYVTARAKILQQNTERMGGRCVVISNSDTGVLCQALAGYFDAVLVDAPCSGEGMFRKEPQAMDGWSLDNISLCAERQLEILSNAAVAVAPNGRIVYSTCTFAPEENEGVIARFLNEHPDFSLQVINVPWGSPGFALEEIRQFLPSISCQQDLTGCRRIFPHQGGEGHFIALLTRHGNGERVSANYRIPEKDPNREAAKALYEACFFSPAVGHFATFGNQVRLLPPQLPDITGCRVIAAGVAVAEVCKNRLEPAHSIYLASSMDNCRNKINLPLDDPRLSAFLHGEEIPIDTRNGWVAVCASGIPVGFGKSVGNRLKNRYPKGLRLL